VSQVVFRAAADASLRIQILTLLRDKAEEKVFHSDEFRQRNMNYALAIFAGIMAVEMKLGSELPHFVLSTILTSLMVIFTIWDRRWHKTKHGWDATSKATYKQIVCLSNDPNQEITVSTYVAEGERTTEWTSLQPIVFYFLVVASISSFWFLGK
jgi:hypothetical protein